MASFSMRSPCGFSVLTWNLYVSSNCKNILIGIVGRTAVTVSFTKLELIELIEMNLFFQNEFCLFWIEILSFCNDGHDQWPQILDRRILINENHADSWLSNFYSDISKSEIWNENFAFELLIFELQTRASDWRPRINRPQTSSSRCLCFRCLNLLQDV